MSTVVDLRRKNIISTPVFSTLLIVFVDLMFFAALISSYFVIKRGRPDFVTDAVLLPVQAAGFNVAVLVLSGVLLLRKQLLQTIIFGSLFLIFQIFLCFKLMAAGLTMTSSIYGGCYYLFVGAHAFHVVFGLIAMMKHYLAKTEDPDAFRAVQIFWLFVVGIWPVLYVQIYLYFPNNPFSRLRKT